MSYHRKPVSKTDESTADSDRIDEEIIDAISEVMMPALDDELEQELGEAALTADDRRALAALGTSEELVSRIITSATDSQFPVSQTDRPTHMSNSSTFPTVPHTDDLHQQGGRIWRFEELMQNLQDSETEEFMSWSCDYRNKGLIGRGGQGLVYLMECLNEQNLPKALKVFSPEPYGNVDAYYNDMERMARVASLVYRIQVDNVVIIERFADHNGIYVMIMRWIDGHDLAWLLRPELLPQIREKVSDDRWRHLNDVVVSASGTMQSRLTPGIAVNIIEKCLRGLDALHSHGIVHGDIKPSNIMLDRFGSIRLIDIGSSFELEAPPRQHALTPRYAAPEVLEGGKWTPLSDLASLGYVLIELLSGRPAGSATHFSSLSTRSVDIGRYQTLLEEKRRLPDRLDEMLPLHIQKSERLMTICRKLIAPDPRQRFQSAEEALEGLDGTYQFLAELTQFHLSVHYAQEIKRWLADVARL